MTRIWSIVVCASLAGAGAVHAQEATPQGSLAEATVDPPEPVQPSTPVPSTVPPAPPQQPPPPPQSEAQQQAQAPAQVAPDTTATGQWVYTTQYGWVFMPYGDQYTYEGTADDVYPYSYVYYPDYGWLWLASPWVWGWGPYPFFGVWGPWHYGWYHGLYHSGWGWGGYRGGGPWHNYARPLPGTHGPLRSGVAGGGSYMNRAAPALRGSAPMNRGSAPMIRATPGGSFGGARGGSMGGWGGGARGGGRR
jgi:hypothetical protein